MAPFFDLQRSWEEEVAGCVLNPFGCALRLEAPHILPSSTASDPTIRLPPMGFQDARLGSVFLCRCTAVGSVRAIQAESIRIRSFRPSMFATASRRSLSVMLDFPVNARRIITWYVYSPMLAAMCAILRLRRRRRCLRRQSANRQGEIIA